MEDPAWAPALPLTQLWNWGRGVFGEALTFSEPPPPRLPWGENGQNETKKASLALGHPHGDRWLGGGRGWQMWWQMWRAWVKPGAGVRQEGGLPRDGPGPQPHFALWGDGGVRLHSRGEGGSPLQG